MSKLDHLIIISIFQTENQRGGSGFQLLDSEEDTNLEKHFEERAQTQEMVSRLIKKYSTSEDFTERKESEHSQLGLSEMGSSG